MENIITELMDKEHERLDNLLADFEKNLLKDPYGARDIFQLFKWNLEKHFFVEEKAVFEVYESVVGDEVSDLFDLMQEHGDIMDLIGKVEKDLLREVKPDISELKSMLEKHRDFEDDVFYPRLDKTLDQDKKREIFARAKEIVR